MALNSENGVFRETGELLEGAVLEAAVLSEKRQNGFVFGLRANWEDVSFV
jgi:hypothetical protein